MNKYVLDANVLIEAKNNHYGMDFCPAFWDWLLVAHKKGLVCSIEAVLDELKQQPDDDEEEDDLSKWVKGTGSCLFLPHDQQMVKEFPVVASWANSQKYTLDAVNTFLGCADMFLVAFGLAHKSIVVTHEKPSDSVKKLKVPDACRGLGVACVRPYDMLRTEGARFYIQSGADAIDAIRH
jgi:hypothetical protein